MAHDDRNINIQPLPNPTPAQIALALIVVKSKPATLSTQDYVDQISSKIVEGDRDTRDNSPYYIDGVKYWKDAYEKSEVEKTRLLEYIHQREQGPDLESFVQDRANSDNNIRRPTRQSSIKANTQLKRVNPDLTSNNEHEKRAESQKWNLAFSILLRSLSTLIKAIIADDDSKLLLLSSRGLCYTLGRYIDNINVAMDGLYQKSVALDFINTCSFISKSYPCILNSINRLEARNQDKSIELIIAEIVDLFIKLLQKFREFTLGAVKCKSLEEENLYRSISSALSTFICRLDVTNHWHEILLEGLVSAYFDHLGSTISLITFADPERSLIDQQGILSPRGLAGDEQDARVLLSAAHIEAPYLVSTLQKIMPVLRQSSARSNHRSQTFHTDVQDEMNQKIRDALQNTLLRGIFDDNDESVKDCFRRQVTSADTNIQELIEQQTTAETPGDWFLSQIWDQLGWDILFENEPDL